MFGSGGLSTKTSISVCNSDVRIIFGHDCVYILFSTSAYRHSSCHGAL